MRRIAFAAALLVVAPACVHVPKEAPALSRELGSRILALRAAHLAAVRAYIGGKRAELDRFVHEQWLPTYAKSVMEEPAIQKVVASATTPADRVEVLTGLGQRIQKRIDQRRSELMRPLDDLERELVGRIQAAYDEVTAGNAALTALLDAHADTSAKQDEILKRLEVDEKLATALGKVEKVVGLITAGKDALEQNQATIGQIIESMRK